MAIRIRPLEPSDVELAAVCELRKAAFFAQSPRTIAEDIAGLRRFAKADGFEVALVAEDGGSILGTCLFVRQELNPVHDLSPWLAGLVVRPERRKQGIGSLLAQGIESHAADVGCRKLHLYTGDAEAFYVRLGWTVADRFVEDAEPMCLMQKIISPA
jgi:predicted N-acetyltransferase YhbS